jgi:hypothetical protein
MCGISWLINQGLFAVGVATIVIVEYGPVITLPHRAFVLQTPQNGIFRLTFIDVRII